MENITLKVKTIPAFTEKVFGFVTGTAFTCRRNRVHLPTEMPFGFPPEARSDVTGFVTQSATMCMLCLDKAAMNAQHILFQEEGIDRYMKEMLDDVLSS